MDQTSSLSDALFKGTSLLDILSPTGGSPAGDVSAAGDLFSSLVSEPAVPATLPLAQDQETAVVAASSLPLSPALSPALSLPEATTTQEDPLVSDPALQNAAELSAALQQVLAVLNSGTIDVSALSEETTGTIGAQTQSENLSSAVDSLTPPEAEQLLSSVSTIVDDLTNAAKVVENSNSSLSSSSTSSSTTRPFEDVIAELLALMQLVVRTLQQVAMTDGGTDAAQQKAVDAATLLSDIADKFSAIPTDDSGLLTLQAAETGRDVSSALLDLLKVAEANAKHVLDALANPAPTDATMVTASSDTAAAATTTTTADSETTTTSLIQIEEDIRAALAFLKERIAAAPPVNRGASSPEVVVAAAIRAVIAEASQGEIAPFLVPEKETLASVSSATIAPKTTETKTVFLKKADVTAEETETLSSPKKSDVPSIASDAAPFAASGSKQTTSDSSSDSGWFQNDNSSFSGLHSDTAAAFTAEGVQAKGVYTFASTLSAFRAAHGGATGLPSIADQVLLHLNRSVKGGESQMSLQLQPSDMGKITVKLDFGADGKVQGSVVADNPKTLEMLQKDSRSLERALQDAGLRAEPGSLEFSLGGGDKQNNAGQTADGKASTASEDGTISAGNEALETIDISAISEAYYITPSGVNIRV